MKKNSSKNSVAKINCDLERRSLEQLYKKFNKKTYVDLDPINQLDPNLSPEDCEICSFISAGLSYGRVEQIQKNINDLWQRVSLFTGKKNGHGLAEYLKNNFSDAAVIKVLKGWKHRLNTEKDIYELLKTLHLLLQEHGSLGVFFQNCYQDCPKEQINLFCQKALEKIKSKKVKKNAKWSGTTCRWFFCQPSDGSSCKRLMMWLRWMLRKDQIDLGLWTQDSSLIDPKKPLPHSSRLFFPLDTHIFQWAQSRGLLKTKAQNWQAVEKVTLFFQKINSEDPVKYDFALCHQSMLEQRRLANSK